MKRFIFFLLFTFFSMPVFCQLNYEKFLFDTTKVYTISIYNTKKITGKFLAKENSEFIFQSDVDVIRVPINKIKNIEMVDDQGTDKPAKRPTIFVYNEKESNYVFDVGGGLGKSKDGFQFGVMANLDIYHILAGVHYNTDVLIPGWGKYKINQLALLAGYRYRNRYLLLSLSTGYAWQKYQCTSGSYYDCYGYKDETRPAIPVHIQGDFIINENFALGLNFNNTYSDRQDIYGIFFCIKFGNFREY